MRRLITTFLPYLLVLLFSILAIWPIVTPGYFPMHDDTQLVRVAQMTLALRDGQFPVRWVKDLGYGYGYPIFNFYNPLPYYFGALFMLVGANALVATKLMFIFPILLGAVGMYLLTRNKLGFFGAIVASTFYTYAPYHAVQIYVRGAVAEYWAYAIIPFLIYFLFKKKIIASGLTLALLILSHNLTTLMIIPILGIISLTQILIAKKRLLTAGYWLLVIGLAFGLSAFFWLPSLVEKSFTNVDSMVKNEFNPLDHFVFIRQLWSSPWGFGGSAPGPYDGFSFMLGQIHIILAIIALIFIAQKIFCQQSIDPIITFASFLLPFSLFMLLPFSRFVWQNLHFLDYLQFPWRYLAFVVFCLSILGGFAVSHLIHLLDKRLPPKPLFIAGYLLLAVFIIFSSKYFQAQFKYGETVDQLLSEPKVKFEYSGRSDEYRPVGAVRPKSFEDLPQTRYEISLDPTESISILENKTHILKLAVKLFKPKALGINIYNFPGWTTYIDGQKVDYQNYKAEHLIQVKVPAGEHLVLTKFQNTPIRTIANIISLVTILFLASATMKPWLLRKIHFPFRISSISTWSKKSR